jgi:hypothetical protein
MEDGGVIPPARTESTPGARGLRPRTPPLDGKTGGLVRCHSKLRVVTHVEAVLKDQCPVVTGDECVNHNTSAGHTGILV